MIGKPHGRTRLEILADDDISRLGDLVGLGAGETLDWVGSLPSGHAGDDGSAQPALQVDPFLTQEDLYGPFDSSSTSVEWEGEDISDLAQRAAQTEKGVVPIEIDALDDEAERWAALCIYEAIQEFYRLIDKPEELMNVSQWLFSNIPGDDEVSFADCCAVHNARPDIVRLRIAFELWRFRKACKAPLPISEFDLPDCVRQSIAFDLGYSAVSLACKLWRQPGATRDQLKATCSAQELDTLPALADRYLASPSQDEEPRWYITGVNPILRNSDQIHPGLNRQRRIELSWSRHFPE
jgi:hypothetical protein